MTRSQFLTKNEKIEICMFSMEYKKKKHLQGSINIGVSFIIMCAVSQWFEWKSIVTVCKNSVDTRQGQHVTGTCLNNSPLLTHQCIGFCLFLTPFKIASFPRHPQGFAELPWIIWRAGEGRQANNNYHIFTMGCESTGPKKPFFLSPAAVETFQTQVDVSYKLGVRMCSWALPIAAW